MVDYWLGETFEEAYVKLANENDGEQMYMFVSKLAEQFEDFSGQAHQMRAAKTGWVIPQHFGDSGSFDIASADKLFGLVSLQEGEYGNNYFAKIDNITIKRETDLNLEHVRCCYLRRNKRSARRSGSKKVLKP